MARPTAQRIAQAREKIHRIRQALGEIDSLCSGTLLSRMKVCGKPGCRCAHDPQARHGPYYEWGHMKGGVLVHRSVTPQQCVFRTIVTDRFGIVTAEFGNVTGHFGDVTDGVLSLV